MKKRLLSLLLAAACLMPLSGCNWGEEPEETYDTLSQYYQQSDSTKQDTRLTSFGLPYLQGETWDPITCADGAQQTLGALLYDPVQEAIGAVHAGWRGVASGLAAKTVRRMQEAFGTEPGDLLAATGPSIGACCFETDDDVPEALRRVLGAAAEPYMVRRGEKWHIDLKGINALWRRQAGVQRIDVCPDCTGCHPERWWSHRKMGDRRGAQAALIALI